MWKKQTVWMIVLVLLVGTVTATICEERVLPRQNCTMLTPVLSCTNYTYDLIATSGQIILTKNLTNLNQSLYFLTFNATQGDYIVRLCDNSTRQIRVTSGEDIMTVSSGIILFSVVVPFLLLIIAFFAQRISKNEFYDTIIRRFLMLISAWLFVLSAGIVLDLATQAGVGLSGEMIIYFEIFQWAGIIGLMSLSLYSVLSFPKSWKANKQKEQEKDYEEE